MHNQEQSAQNARECETLLKECGREADTIQEKIQKLQNAVDNKKDAYTRDQLQTLKHRLEDAKKNLIDLEKGGK